MIVDLFAADSKEASRAAQVLAFLLTHDESNGELGVLEHVDSSGGILENTGKNEWKQVRPLTLESHHSVLLDTFKSTWLRTLGGLALCCALIAYVRRRALTWSDRGRMRKGATLLAQEDPFDQDDES